MKTTAIWHSADLEFISSVDVSAFDLSAEADRREANYREATAAFERQNAWENKRIARRVYALIAVANFLFFAGVCWLAHWLTR